MTWNSKKGHESGQEQSGQAGLGAARSFLQGKGLDRDRIEKVLYAVEVHSFSRESVLSLGGQDPPGCRPSGCHGAIGIARLFVTGGALGREMYHPQDPFCRDREPDDARWNLDHFIESFSSWNRHAYLCRKEACRKRARVLKQYLQDLEEEIGI